MRKKTPIIQWIYVTDVKSRGESLTEAATDLKRIFNFCSLTA